MKKIFLAFVFLCSASLSFAFKFEDTGGSSGISVADVLNSTNSFTATQTIPNLNVNTQLIVGETTAKSTFTPTAITLDDGVTLTNNGISILNGITTFNNDTNFNDSMTVKSSITIQSTLLGNTTWNGLINTVTTGQFGALKMRIKNGILYKCYSSDYDDSLQLFTITPSSSPKLIAGIAWPLSWSHSPMTPMVDFVPMDSKYGYGIVNQGAEGSTRTLVLVDIQISTHVYPVEDCTMPTDLPANGSAIEQYGGDKIIMAFATLKSSNTLRGYYVNDRKVPVYAFGKTLTLGSYINDIRVVGSRLYVVCESPNGSHMYCYDITNFENWVELWNTHLDTANGEPRDLAIKDNYMATVSWFYDTAGLCIYNLSSGAPVFISSTPIPSAGRAVKWIGDVIVVGMHSDSGAANDQLRFYDASNLSPRVPLPVISSALGVTTGNIDGLEGYGEYVYASCYQYNPEIYVFKLPSVHYPTADIGQIRTDWLDVTQGARISGKLDCAGMMNVNGINSGESISTQKDLSSFGSLSIGWKTEAELKAITPKLKGLIYYDSTNDEFVRSTGTVTSLDWAKIDDKTAVPTGW